MPELGVVRFTLLGRRIKVGAENLVQRLPERVHVTHPVRCLRVPVCAG